MIKSLILFILIINSCASGNGNDEAKQDSASASQNKQQPINMTSKKEIMDSCFLFFWKEFTDAVKSKNQITLKQMSFDSLECEHKNVYIDEFIKSHFAKVFDNILLNKLSESNALEFIDEKLITSYMPSFVLKESDRGEFIMKKKINITKIDKYPDGPLTIVLEFIETKGGYKFYGYDMFG